jgi:hypothetical protein
MSKVFATIPLPIRGQLKMNMQSSQANSHKSSIDSHLHSWDEIKHDFHKGAILLGNGFSCAVWEPFGYSSLFEKASSGEGIQHGLSPEDEELFNEMATQNFEAILFALAQTSQVSEIFHQNPELFQTRYEHIKLALGEAVRAVHIPRYKLDDGCVLSHIRQELRNYQWVFSTNYDLLIYWAMMYQKPGAGSMNQKPGLGFKDYFWSAGCSFDITDTGIRQESDTRVLYLHGALHLKRDPDSWSTSKLTNDGLDSILSRLDVPLFVTEGSPESKMKAVRKSDYLSFASQQLAACEKPLVIFGHSLGSSDTHLVDAIKKKMPSKVAISIRGCNSPEDIIKRKVEIRHKLSHNLQSQRRPDMIFFDAATHPLGSEEIRVSPQL